MISIPHGKCLEILDLCRSFINKNHVTRKQLQSLLGKLPPSHIFVNRLLNILHNCQTKVRVCSERKKDVHWFMPFLMGFNKKIKFPQMRDTLDIYVNASLSGMRAIWCPIVYAVSCNLVATWDFNITQLVMPKY